MSSIYRIKENMENFTETEMKIANYILEYTEEVIHLSSQMLAKKVDSSPASLIRFSRKIGYSGFSNLKLELAKDTGEPIEPFDNLIRKEDTVKTMILKAKQGNIATFENTYKLLNESDIQLAFDLIKKAKKVYILGIGGSGIVCKDLFHKFLRINKDAVYHEDFHLNMSAITYITKDDLVIALSYSGETREIKLAQEAAKNRGAKTIAITQVGRNSLSKNCDLVLNIPKEESEFRLGSIASRFSMLAITDLLYFGTVKDDIQNTKEKIMDTRKNILNLR